MNYLEGPRADVVARVGVDTSVVRRARRTTVSTAVDDYQRELPDIADAGVRAGGRSAALNAHL